MHFDTLPPQPTRPALSEALGASLPGHLRHALWQGDQLSAATQEACTTGYAALDQELPGGGWPQGALSELLLEHPGQGELRLLAPALARLSSGGQELVWISPPERPHAPALQGLGVRLRHLLWVRATSPEDAAWAAEQALRSRSCGAVLWWSHEAGRPARLNTTLRRLHLAAQASSALLLVLRPAQAAQLSSPAPLRLQIQAAADAPGQLEVQVLKRRGPPLLHPLRLDTQAQLPAVLRHRLGLPLPALPRIHRPHTPQLPQPSATSVRPDLGANLGAGLSRLLNVTAP
jgi:hypothetical protein